MMTRVHLTNAFFSLRRQIRDQLRLDVVQLQQRLPNLKPGLAIVQVGGREDSNVYIRMKIRAAAEIGIDAQHVHLPRTSTQLELLNKVMVQLWLWIASIGNKRDCASLHFAAGRSERRSACTWHHRADAARFGAPHRCASGHRLRQSSQRRGWVYFRK